MTAVFGIFFSELLSLMRSVFFAAGKGKEIYAKPEKAAVCLFKFRNRFLTG